MVEWWFTSIAVNTPLCCKSRLYILSGDSTVNLTSTTHPRAAQLLSWNDGTAVNKWMFDNVTVRAFGSFSLAPMTLSSILGSNDAKSVFLRVSFSPKAHSGYVNYTYASFDECAKLEYYQYAKANLCVTSLVRTSVCTPDVFPVPCCEGFGGDSIIYY
jgi:hypothetical protein